MKHESEREGGKKIHERGTESKRGKEKAGRSAYTVAALGSVACCSELGLALRLRELLN